MEDLNVEICQENSSMISRARPRMRAPAYAVISDFSWWRADDRESRREDMPGLCGPEQIGRLLLLGTLWSEKNCRLTGNSVISSLLLKVVKIVRTDDSIYNSCLWFDQRRPERRRRRRITQRRRAPFCLALCAPGVRRTRQVSPRAPTLRVRQRRLRDLRSPDRSAVRR
jgi:hypothetical protein